MVSLAVLAGCARTGDGVSAFPESDAPNGVHPSAAGYKLVYSFKPQPDGIRPLGGLALAGGALWSTTSLGGGGKCIGGLGCGVVFKITPAGAETVAYEFKGGADGGTPAAGLTLLGGKLYGTASRGGDSKTCPGTSCGTVFEISTAAAFRTVYDFKAGNDAQGPYAGLVALDGVLYGTTARGGSSATCTGGCGTVFSVTPAGAEKVLYSFKGGNDGSVPLAGLTVIGGVLYGTTQQSGSAGNGTVFKITTAGKLTTLYGFKGSPDGAGPVQDLTTSKTVPNTLFGITQNGGTTGTKNCGQAGCGTVYSITTLGKETVLYRFKGSPDGTHPYASVTAVGADLYGTTGLGGLVSCYQGNGCGTIFKLTPSGAGYKESVVYAFTISGTYPQSGFTSVNGTLFATSHGGGQMGYGSVYSFTP